MHPTFQPGWRCEMTELKPSTQVLANPSTVHICTEEGLLVLGAPSLRRLTFEPGSQTAHAVGLLLSSRVRSAAELMRVCRMSCAEALGLITRLLSAGCLLPQADYDAVLAALALGTPAVAGFLLRALPADRIAAAAAALSKTKIAVTGDPALAAPVVEALMTTGMANVTSVQDGRECCADIVIALCSPAFLDDVATQAPWDATPTLICLACAPVVAVGPILSPGGLVCPECVLEYWAQAAPCLGDAPSLGVGLGARVAHRLFHFLITGEPTVESLLLSGPGEQTMMPSQHNPSADSRVNPHSSGQTLLAWQRLPQLAARFAAVQLPDGAPGQQAGGHQSGWGDAHPRLKLGAPRPTSPRFDVASSLTDCLRDLGTGVRQRAILPGVAFEWGVIASVVAQGDEWRANCFSWSVAARELRAVSRKVVTRSELRPVVAERSHAWTLLVLSCRLAGQLTVDSVAILQEVFVESGIRLEDMATAAAHQGHVSRVFSAATAAIVSALELDERDLALGVLSLDAS